jgi:hypothetical protein
MSFAITGDEKVTFAMAFPSCVDSNESLRGDNRKIEATPKMINVNQFDGFRRANQTIASFFQHAWMDSYSSVGGLLSA